jgi:hypothetical protein
LDLEVPQNIDAFIFHNFLWFKLPPMFLLLADDVSGSVSSLAVCQMTDVRAVVCQCLVCLDLEVPQNIDFFIFHNFHWFKLPPMFLLLADGVSGSIAFSQLCHVFLCSMFEQS